MDKAPAYNPGYQGGNPPGPPPQGYYPPQGPPPSYAPPGQLPPQYPPQQGQFPPQGQFPQQGMPPAGPYPGQPVVVTQPTTTIVVVGAGCPACRAGVLEPEFTCCGVCLGIWLFPLGLLCCFGMREKVCTNCNARF